MAAIDVSALGTALLENIQAVSLVGVACLGIWGAISAFKVLREMLSLDDGGGRVGGGSNVSAGDRLGNAREHAMQMQMLGEGQSDAYAAHEKK